MDQITKTNADSTAKLKKENEYLKTSNQKEASNSKQNISKLQREIKKLTNSAVRTATEFARTTSNLKLEIQDLKSLNTTIATRSAVTISELEKAIIDLGISKDEVVETNARRILSLENEVKELRKQNEVMKQKPNADERALTNTRVEFDRLAREVERERYPPPSRRGFESFNHAIAEEEDEIRRLRQTRRRLEEDIYELNAVGAARGRRY